MQAIERAGGKITCAYYTPLNLRALLKPDKFLVIPRRAMPIKVCWLSLPSPLSGLLLCVLARGWVLLVNMAVDS